MLRRSRCVLIFSSNNHYFFKKNLNAPRPSDQGGETVKTFRWDHRLQIQNLMIIRLSLGHHPTEGGCAGGD